MSPPRKKPKYVNMEENIHRIVSRYDEYREKDDQKSYVRAIGHNVAGILSDD